MYDLPNRCETLWSVVTPICFIQFILCCVDMVTGNLIRHYVTSFNWTLGDRLGGFPLICVLTRGSQFTLFSFNCYCVVNNREQLILNNYFLKSAIKIIFDILNIISAIFILFAFTRFSLCLCFEV